LHPDPSSVSRGGCKHSSSFYRSENDDRQMAVVSIFSPKKHSEKINSCKYEWVAKKFRPGLRNRKKKKKERLKAAMW
jgi:hypothetical protein